MSLKSSSSKENKHLAMERLEESGQDRFTAFIEGFFDLSPSSISFVTYNREVKRSSVLDLLRSLSWSYDDSSESYIGREGEKVFVVKDFCSFESVRNSLCGYLYIQQVGVCSIVITVGFGKSNKIVYSENT